MPRRIFVDTEWTAAPWSPDCRLLWIGLADEDGRIWSAVDADIDLEALGSSSLVPLIGDGQVRLGRPEMAESVRAFVGAEVDEWWAWIPSVDRVADWFDLGDEADDLHARHRDVDLRMLRELVEPWPEGWSLDLRDLNAEAVVHGVELPERRPDHLDPGVHVAWNRELFGRIVEGGGPSQGR